MRIFAVWCLGNPIHSPTVSTAKYWNIYQIKHVWLSTYLHIIFTGFLLIFTEEIMLLNIKYSLAVWASLYRVLTCCIFTKIGQISIGIQETQNFSSKLNLLLKKKHTQLKIVEITLPMCKLKEDNWLEYPNATRLNSDGNFARLEQRNILQCHVHEKKSVHLLNFKMFRKDIANEK